MWFAVVRRACRAAIVWCWLLPHLRRRRWLRRRCRVEPGAGSGAGGHRAALRPVLVSVIDRVLDRSSGVGWRCRGSFVHPQSGGCRPRRRPSPAGSASRRQECRREVSLRERARGRGAGSGAYAAASAAVAERAVRRREPRHGCRRAPGVRRFGRGRDVPSVRRRGLGRARGAVRGAASVGAGAPPSSSRLIPGGSHHCGRLRSVVLCRSGGAAEGVVRPRRGKGPGTPRRL
jgi:hypothetical protein